MIYGKLHELRGNTLQLKDRVIFVFKGRTYVYTVRGKWLDYEGGFNDEILCRILNIPGSNIYNQKGEDSEEYRTLCAFCEQHYGYRPNRGRWPECEMHDFQALTNLVLFIFKKLEQKKKPLLAGDLF